jgi:16S rRNA (guanine527-N7)-methyltransferase
MIALLNQHLKQAGLDPSPEKVTLLAQYIDLLFQWNKVYNLTAAQDEEDFILHHILDSLLPGQYLLGDNIIDVGSGAGLPGIPLAIYYPDKSFTLLESRGKRSRFLRTVIQTLKLKNVHVVSERAQDYQPGAVYTTVITRAFSSLANMLHTTQHLCHPNGLFLAMKGRYPQNELKEIDPIFVVSIQQRLIIPGVDKERYIIGVIHKENECGENSRDR